MLSCRATKGGCPVTDGLDEILADITRFAMTLDGSARLVAQSLIRRWESWQDDHFPDQVIRARPLLAKALDLSLVTASRETESQL